MQFTATVAAHSNQGGIITQMVKIPGQGQYNINGLGPFMDQMHNIMLVLKLLNLSIVNGFNSIF